LRRQQCRYLHQDVDGNLPLAPSSAKFHIDLKATNHGIPEGLARVLDVIVSKIGPHEIEAAKTPSQGPADRGNDRAKEIEPDK